MIYYFDEEKVNVDLNKLNILGEGSQGKAYQFSKNLKKYVIKIFNSNDIEEKDFIILKNLNTERILLPKKLIYDNEKKFIGYTTIFCKKKKVIEISKQKFIDELGCLISEIKYLSDNNIVIDDWNFSNFIFDDSFRLIDPGKYKICQIDQNSCYYYNYLILCDFIANKLFNYMLSAHTDCAKYYSTQLYEKSKEDIVLFFQNELNQKETIYQYTKRITKNK